MMKYLLLALLTCSALTAQSSPWVGNLRATSSRANLHPCTGGAELRFGGWEQQRATITSICFEVYESGVTDRAESEDSWKDLDVQLHFRFHPNAPYSTEYIHRVDPSGHNFRYAFDFRKFNPFFNGFYLCPEEDIVALRNESWGESANMQFYITVNESQLGSADAPLVLEYQNSAREQRRSFCQSR
jgi:hypothetical protein